MKTKLLYLSLLFQFFSAPHSLLFGQDSLHKNALSENLTMKWWNNLSSEWQRYFTQNLQFNLPIDTNELEKLKDLGGVDLHGYKIDDLSPLKALPWLMYLNCTGTGIKSLEPVRALQQLRTVICDSVGICDLTPLYSLSQLKFVRLRRTQVPKADIQAFINKSKIKVVYQ